MPKKNEGEPYYRLTLDEAAEMHGQDGILIVDVRGPDEYVTGHVEGAVSIPVDEVLSRVGELPTDQKLLFICAAGVRSGTVDRRPHCNADDVMIADLAPARGASSLIPSAPSVKKPLIDRRRTPVEPLQVLRARGG